MKRLLIVASTILLITGCASDQNQTYRGTTGSMGASTDAGYGIGVAPTQQGAGAVQLTSTQLGVDEIKFLKRAAEYNQTDIQLGQAIVQKTDNIALKTLGQRLVDDHTLADQHLQAIIAQTGASVPSAPNAEQQQMLDRLSGLTGTDFDRAAIQNSIVSQQRQVNLYTSAANNAQTPEVKTYAQQTLTMVQDELTQAQQLTLPAQTAFPAGTTVSPQQPQQ